LPGSSAGPPTSGDPAARPRRTAVLAVTAAGLFVADLVTKVLVVAELAGREPVRLLGGALYLTYARNPGAAFSFAEGATVLFSAVAAIVVAVIVRTASRLRSLPWAICLGLILGGAAGNLVDRTFRSPGPLRGQVVDWISAFDPAGRVWPIFNVADSGIVVGGILAVLLAALGYEMDGTRHRRGDPDPTSLSPSTGPAPAPGGPAGRPPPASGAAGPPGSRPAGPDGPHPGPRDPGQHPATGRLRPGGGAAGDGYVPSSGPLAGPGPDPPSGGP
jgi:signal peptidase II